MIWHIAKRELYENLNSLRFALTTVLLLALMLTNAIVHLREHPVRIQEYRTSVADYENALRARTDLYDIAQQGPGWLYKKPSPLHFCAEGGDTFLPSAARGSGHFWEDGDLKSLWRMTYPSVTSNLKNIRPDVTKVDWAFIIGYMLSLIALLFTFDSITGERERGTLRLMLSNPIPRYTVLIGKFLGAFISIYIPFALAVLINLLLISSASAVQLDAEAWVRLGIIIFIAFLYTCLFLALGMLVSARAQRSAVSLVMLLLFWVSFVVFMPGALALIANRFSSTPMSSDELWEHQKRLDSELFDKYVSRLWEDESSRRILARSEYVTIDAENQQRLTEEHLAQQIAHGKRARTITCISPAAILQHLLESFSGTGFERHLQFLENTRRYAHHYREFVVDIDRADPQSPHLIGVREGMSQKPVSPEAIPTFEDTLRLKRDFNTASTNLLLLVLFCVVLLSDTYLAFVRAEV